MYVKAFPIVRVSVCQTLPVGYAFNGCVSYAIQTWDPECAIAFNIVVKRSWNTLSFSSKLPDF